MNNYKLMYSQMLALLGKQDELNALILIAEMTGDVAAKECYLEKRRAVNEEIHRIGNAGQPKASV